MGQTKDQADRFPLRDRAIGLLVIVIWGLNFIAVKAGTIELPPLLLTGLRFSTVALLSLPFSPRLPSQWRLILLLSALMGGCHFGLLFVSVAGLDVPTAAIVGQLAVPFSALVARFFYRERLGWRGAAGLALSFGGVVLVVGEPQHASPWSIVLGIFSAAAWAFSMVVIKRIGPISPMALNGWMALFAAPLLICLSLLFEDGQVRAIAQARWLGWGAVAYTAMLATMTGYTLWYRLLARYPINRVVPMTLLGPVVAVIAGYLLFGGLFGWSKILGGAATLAGVAVLQLRPAATRKG